MSTMSPSVAPTATSHPAVIAATELAREARILGSTAAILGWDQETMMPNGGLAHRARQFAQLARLEHGMATDKRLGELLEAAAEATASNCAPCPDPTHPGAPNAPGATCNHHPAALLRRNAAIPADGQASRAHIEIERPKSAMLIEPSG
jgi:hypothetical protein